jgi:3-dehydroquinate synthase
MTNRKVRVGLGARSYEIRIASGLVTQVGGRVKKLLPQARFGIITDAIVWNLHGKALAEGMARAGYDAPVAAITPGESSKNLDTVAELYERCLDWELQRSDAIIAFGGGVVGDIAGFVAATYMRGIPVIQVPTTVLACVDSSVGGKTGVDLPRAKNMVGVFHQPRAVVIDPELLLTLERRQFTAGLGEVVKHGVILDEKYFRYLEDNVEAIVEMAPDVMREVIYGSCKIKAAVVSADERERGQRAILNYGHTFGHALEASSGYGKYLHGEAISLGMVVAAGVAHEKTLMIEEDCERQRRLMMKLNMPVMPDEFDVDKVIEHAKYDKKGLMGKLRMVLPTKIGRVVIQEVSEADLRAGIRHAFGL